MGDLHYFGDGEGEVDPHAFEAWADMTRLLGITVLLFHVDLHTECFHKFSSAKVSAIDMGNFVRAWVRSERCVCKQSVSVCAATAGCVGFDYASAMGSEYST